MRRRWQLHAEPLNDSEFARILADVYNERPMRYWFWSTAKRSTQVAELLGAQVRLTIVDMKG